ncbi:MAG: nuclear transport factor 2 family protein [Acidobacteriota bacterium]|nr:nuclear transport factor 2 family protein [Acidobacteriota bacterium]
MHNLELVKNLYQAFAQGDVPSVLALLDENIVWTEAEGFPYGGTYNGHEAVVSNVFMKLATEWDDYRVEPNDFLDADNRIVALGNYSGAYKKTGKSMRAPFAHVWTIENGKATKFVQYTDTLKVSEAL